MCLSSSRKYFFFQLPFIRESVPCKVFFSFYFSFASIRPTQTLISLFFFLFRQSADDITSVFSSAKPTHGGAYDTFVSTWPTIFAFVSRRLDPRKLLRSCLPTQNEFCFRFIFVHLLADAIQHFFIVFCSFSSVFYR